MGVAMPISNIYESMVALHHLKARDLRGNPKLVDQLWALEHTPQRWPLGVWSTRLSWIGTNEISNEIHIVTIHCQSKASLWHFYKPNLLRKPRIRSIVVTPCPLWSLCFWNLRSSTKIPVSAAMDARAASVILYSWQILMNVVFLN